MKLFLPDYQISNQYLSNRDQAIRWPPQNIYIECNKIYETVWYLEPLLLIYIDFNLSMEKVIQ